MTTFRPILIGGFPINVLVACESSGHVREAFRRRGFDAVSCDLQPADDGSEHHIQGDVFDVIEDRPWDLIIAHPSCTYLTSSGLHWNGRIPGRAAKTEEALEFVRDLMSLDAPFIAIENPQGCIGTRIDARDFGFRTAKATQYIQPHQFGADASKKTGLWLKGLPDLEPTEHVEPRMVDGKPRWANQTDSGQNRLAPSPDRWKIRSQTYTGIADAMAQQWGDFLVDQFTEDAA